MGRASVGHRIGIIAKEEPPAAASRGSSILNELVAIVPQLRGERGIWHRVAEFASPSGAATAGKRLRDKYPDQVETRHKTEADGSVLWARWTGSRTNGDGR